MPKYLVEMQDGRKFQVEADSAPTEEEVLAHLSRQEQSKPGTNSSLGLASVRPAANVAAEVATNPALPKTAASIGRITGAIAPAIAGGIEGGPVGGAAGLMAAAKGSWLGGKTGYFTGKLIQNAAIPVAKGLEAIAPVASALSGAAGVGDLAQMAEPNRKDIGFLGLGPSVNVPGAEPPLINGLLARLRARFGSK